MVKREECYFGINDKIVRDCLDSLHIVSEKPVVVGGLAIQLHGSEREKILRKTSDVDLLVLSDLSFDDFRQGAFQEVYPFIKRQGYHLVPKRGRGNHAAKVTKNMNKKDQQIFLMHWTKFNPKYYDAFMDYIKKQINFSKDIEYNSQNLPVKTASLEEILPLKIRRATIYGTDREELVGPIYSSLIENAKKGNWGTLASVPLTEMGKGLLRMQRKLEEKEPYTRERFSTYKLSKDIYDLCLASRLISDDMGSFEKDRYEENIARIEETMH